MSETRANDVTSLLQRVADGSAGALDELTAIVYDDLRAVADRHMRRVFGGRMGGITLQPTALVNETFLKLIKQRQRFDNRGHFFAIATKVMLRVLLDDHRRRAAAKRGGAWVRVAFDPEQDPRLARHSPEVPALVEALEKLEKLDSRKAEVVKLRVLWGLTLPEVARALGAARATVARDWKFARAWLAKELTEKEDRK